MPAPEGRTDSWPDEGGLLRPLPAEATSAQQPASEQAPGFSDLNGNGEWDRGYVPALIQWLRGMSERLQTGDSTWFDRLLSSINDLSDAREGLLKGALATQAETINQAIGYKARLVANAKAERDKFLVQLRVYRKAPQIFLSRVYLDTIEDVLKDQRLMVVPVAQEDVEVIDMQERLRPQLLELDVNKNQEGR